MQHSDDTRWPPLLIPYFLFTHRTHQWYPTMHCNTSQHPRWSLVPYNSWQCPLWYLTIPSPIPAILASCFALELWEVRIDSRPAGGGRSSLRSQIQTPGCSFKGGLPHFKRTDYVTHNQHHQRHNNHNLIPRPTLASPPLYWTWDDGSTSSQSV